MPAKTRVLLVHNIMAPYRYPLFRALANQPGVELTVWFMARSAKNRRWAPGTNEDLGFKYEILPAFQFNYFTRDLFTYIFNYTFPWRFSRRPFDVLISAGWLDFSTQAGFLISKLLHRKFIVWSDSTANEPSWRRTVAAPLVRTMVSGADACVASGTRSKQYLRMLGAREADVFTAHNTVDVELFRRLSTALRPDRQRRKTELGIRRGRVLLYCGQFIERKGVRQLIDAFARIKRQYADVALLLIGYGPLRTKLQHEVNKRGLSDVHFLDHVEVAEMPSLYALADIFVLPSSEETWGLVVNEAMACALPVILTDRVGSAPDLVDEGRNGFVVPVGDPEKLAERCVHLLSDAELLARFSSCSAERIRHFTPENAANGFAQAIQHSIGLR